MLRRTLPFRNLVALSVLAAGCAAGDGITNPAGAAGTGSGGTDGVGPGGGDGGTSGTDVTSSTSKASSGSQGNTTTGGTTTSSSDGGAGPSGPGGAGGADGGGAPNGGGGAGTSAGGGDQGGGGSPPLPECGDGTRNGTEVCEGADLDGETCESIGQGFVDGTLACTASCTFDTTACIAPPDCGNGIIETGEDCDGVQLGGATCQTEGFASGTVSCTGGCALDTSACFTCGNDVIEAGELCDGSALGGQTCQNLGHTAGTLACNGSCDGYVQTACSDCGDGQIESPEACDGSNFGGATCASMGFTAGTLACTNSCTVVGTGNCYTCGNGVISGAEVCDGAALNGQTCISLGYEVGGTLACGANCLGYNTAQCIDSQCNDGIDNDGDGFVDFSADVGCTASADASESNYAASCAGAGGPITDITIADTLQNYYYTFNSSAAPAVFSGSCGGNGREMTFVYRSPIAQPWIIFTTDEPPTNFDTVLYVRNGACNGSQLACNDDDPAYIYNLRASTVTINNVAAGQLLFITVDAFASNTGGTFAISVYPASAN